MTIICCVLLSKHSCLSLDKGFVSLCSHCAVQERVPGLLEPGMAAMKPRELARTAVTILEVLGRGNFGEVSVLCGQPTLVRTRTRWL